MYVSQRFSKVIFKLIQTLLPGRSLIFFGTEVLPELLDLILGLTKLRIKVV